MDLVIIIIFGILYTTPVHRSKDTFDFLIAGHGPPGVLNEGFLEWPCKGRYGILKGNIFDGYVYGHEVFMINPKLYENV